MLQLGVVEPLTLRLLVLPSGSTSGRSGIQACSAMPWFLRDGLMPTAQGSDILISTVPLSYGIRTPEVQE